MSSLSEESSSDAAHAASHGGTVPAVTTAAAWRGSRRWITRVPARKSPIRLPSVDSSEHSSAGKPDSTQNSSTPSRPRTSACRNRSGLPSSPVTRSPSAYFPGVAPLEAVSQITG
jgi:hypothetical protein